MNGHDDPLRGFHYSETVGVDSGPASNDVYGKLFCHLQDLLQTFRARLSTIKRKFLMLNMDATELPEHLSGEGFARIEVRLSSCL